jgi:translation initiation factor eIF-2B subunit epsilon
VFNLSALSVSLESISTLNTSSIVDSDPEEPSLQKYTHHRTPSSASFLSDVSEDGPAGNSQTDDPLRDIGGKHHFHQEAASSLYDSLQRGDDSANMQLELNALRLSTNASEHAVRRAVAAAFGRYIVKLADPAGAHAMSIKAAVDTTLSRHVNLLSRIVFDSHFPQKDDQVDLLLVFQADLAKRRDGDSVLLHLANELVRLDIVEADGIEQWWTSEKSGEEGDMARVRVKTKQLVEFLLEDDESDEEEDESGDDADESDGN